MSAMPNSTSNASTNSESEIWLRYETLSDIDILIGNERIKSQKAVLMWKSSVFEKLLRDNPEKSEIVIDDCDVAVFKVFLNFLYSSHVKDEDITIDLLLVAHKYLIRRLIRICDIKLSTQILSEESVIRHLIAAAECGCKMLKRKAAVFVSDALQTLRQTDNFQCIYLHEKAVEAVFDTLLKDEAYSDFVATAKVDSNHLFTSGMLSDFTIIIGKEELKVHKVILMIKSPVFETMLNSNMTERKSDKLFISDIDASTFRTFLKYLYSDIIDPEHITVELLYAAQKYMIPALIDICSVVLCWDLDDDNAAKILVASVLCNCDDLRDMAAEAIVQNYINVRKTEDFKLVYKHKDAMDAVFNSITQSKMAEPTSSSTAVYYNLKRNKNWGSVAIEFSLDSTSIRLDNGTSGKLNIYFVQKYGRSWYFCYELTIKIVLVSRSHGTVYINRKFKIYRNENFSAMTINLETLEDFEGHQLYDCMIIYSNVIKYKP